MSVADATNPMRVCGGVDWAKDDHAVCVVGVEGEAQASMSAALRAQRHDRSEMSLGPIRRRRLACFLPW